MTTDAFAAGVEAVVAAERIAELEAAVGTLRRALGEIVHHERFSFPDAGVMGRARAALAATEPDGGGRS